jgi:hypothetical protein
MSLPLRRALCVCVDAAADYAAAAGFFKRQCPYSRPHSVQVLSVPGSAGCEFSFSKSRTMPMKLRKKRSM